MNPDFLFVHTTQGFERVIISQLYCVCISKGRVELLGKNGIMTCKSEIGQLEKALLPYRFMRVHPGFIISLDKVISFDKRKVFLPGIEVPIGRGFAAALLQRVKLLSPQPPLSQYHQLVIGKDGRLRKAQDPG